MKTTDRIEELAANLAPVRPLRPPALRAAVWVLAALVAAPLLLLAVRGWTVSLRPDPALGVFLALSAVAFSLGGVLALGRSIPGWSDRLVRVGFWSALVGIALLEVGRLTWETLAGPLSFESGFVWPCARDVVLAGLPPFALLLWMVRRGFEPSVLSVGPAVGFGAGLTGACALRLFCANDEPLHNLLSHLAPLLVLVLAALPGLLARFRT